VRIIKESFLKAAAAEYPRAAEALAKWVGLVKSAEWTTPVQMKQTFKDVDPVEVKSGNTVYVFNIRRNEFRLIAAVHFNARRVYTLRFFTHKQYDLIDWTEEL